MDYFSKKSNWIWISDKYDNNNALVVYFRKEIVIEKEADYATIQVSADSRYRLYVNGESVVTGPCKGDRQVWYYDEVDIKHFLHVGTNVFAAIVLRYPAKIDGIHSIWRTEIPGLFLTSSIRFQDGTEQLMKTDESWKYFIADNIQITKHNPYFDPLYITEKAAGDVRTYGWKKDGYTCAYWSNAVVYPDMAIQKEVSPGNLLPRPIPFLFENNRMFSDVVCARSIGTELQKWESLIKNEQLLTVAPHSMEIVEISAGEEQTGYLVAAFAGGKGARISILCSEAYAYQPEGEIMFMQVPVKADRTDYINGRLQGTVDTYNIGGFGSIEQPEEYEPFWFRTFRYVQLTVETQDEPLTLSKFAYRETGYPLEVKTKVDTSDESLKAIWDISERTLRRCMHETYEDCPYYEQLQYIMDSRSQILFTYNTAADDRLARKCIDDFARSQRYDGLMNSCYPSYGPHVIPGFSIYFILMIHDHMMYFGEKKLVERYLPIIDRVLQFFDNRLEPSGLTARTSDKVMGDTYWPFVDWVQQWQRGVPNAIYQGPITIDSLLYCMGLQRGAELANYIGLPDVADRYRKKAAEIKTAVLLHCVGRDGLIMDGPGVDEYSQHVQVFAVLTDVVSGFRAKEIMEIALTDKSLAQCSVAMAWYLFRALEKVGLYVKTETLWDIWRQMVANKLTTCVEDGVNGRSDCHAWGALALYELPAVILGVRPAEPGYKSIFINPYVDYLKWAKGNVITPIGMIHVEWNKIDCGTIDLKIDAPDGITVISGSRNSRII